MFLSIPEEPISVEEAISQFELEGAIIAYKSSGKNHLGVLRRVDDCRGGYRCGFMYLDSWLKGRQDNSLALLYVGSSMEESVTMAVNASREVRVYETVTDFLEDAMQVYNER